MATIVTRAGKGSPLTNAEVDANFTNLNTEVAAAATTATWTGVTGKPATLAGYGITDAQPVDADLTAIAALAGTSGFLKKTAANTWTLDTAAYLTGINSSQVTTALGFTPYNATNPSGYITSAALGSYLPLSGGTLTGDLVAPSVKTNKHSDSSGRVLSYDFSTTASTAVGDLDSYFDTGEALELFSFAPTGNSHNYYVEGTVKIQSAESVETLFIRAAIRSQTRPDMTWSGQYERYSEANFLAATPVFWVNETTGTGELRLVLKFVTTNIQDIECSFKVFQRAAYGEALTVTAAHVNGSAPTDFVEYALNKRIDLTPTGLASATFIGALSGNASTATTLQNARTINGVSFNGSANITVVDATKLPLAGGTMAGDITFAGSQTWPTFNQNTTGNAATVTSITSGQVTTALGYTPVNPTAIGSTVQAYDADLAAIAALAGTTGFLKKTAANTWALDTSAYLTGNQSISFTGDATGSGSTSVALTLANSGVTAGTYGSATNIPQFAVDAKGRVTSVSNVAVSIPSGSLTFTGDVTGSGSTGSSTALTLANSGVTAGTYRSVTVDAKGRVTTGSNPTTLSGYGITDAINVSQKAVANGVATLDGAGLVPASQLPSYVDDVLEYANLAGFPATGQAGKIYVAIDTNKTYRWSGTVYIYITSGAVDSVAGKTGVVTLVKGDVGLGSVDNTADAAKNVLSATKLTTARTIGGVSFDGTASINLPGVNAAGNQSTTGNAATATTLQTARTINGTSFDGSANILTANWGTARTLTLGATGKSVSGAANVAWTFSEIAAGQTITTSGSSASIIISDTGASGANIRLTGNGATTPSKTIRAQSGLFQVINNAYTTPCMTVDDAGNFTANANVIAYSDERLKKDWAPVASDFVARLATLKSGTYTRIDSGERQAGSSAQDWQKLLPEVVASKDETGILGLAYGNAALVSAIELAKDNLELRARIERLEAALSKLIGD